MKKLIELLKLLPTFLDEARKIDRVETESKKEIEEVLADGKIEDDAELRKLSNAQTRLALVPARRKQIESQLRQSQGELRGALRGAARQWAQFVAGKKDEQFSQFVAAVLPFFENDERAVRRKFQPAEVPACYEISRCFWEEHISHPTAEQDYESAKRFVNKVHQSCKKFGWPEPDLG